MNSKSFDYNEAFSRNLGWTTEEEQEKLKKTCVAIAGMGGVGGNYLLTLCRLGVGRFHISDFDRFELANFNRQVGATVSNLGKSKLEVMLDMAKDINPDVQIKTFPEGIHERNLSEFLTGVDVYLDGLDVFCLELREKLFAQAYDRGVHALTIAPVGMGAALMHFPVRGMKFDKYFGLSTAKSIAEKALFFVMGLVPSGIHRKSLVLTDRLDFKNKKAPSTFMGCQLCAGVAGAEILKFVLKRGPLIKAPQSLHFDAYSYKYKKTTLYGGYKNPFHRFKLWLAKKTLTKLL